MQILVKMISPKVTSVSGYLVYVLDSNKRPIRAEVCDLETLVPTIIKLETLFEL